MAQRQFTLNQQQKKAAGELASVVSAAKAAASAMFNTALGQSSGSSIGRFKKGFFPSQGVGCRYPVCPVLIRKYRPVTVWRYRVSLQRKKCCQQIIGLNDESFSVAMRP